MVSDGDSEEVVEDGGEFDAVYYGDVWGEGAYEVFDGADVS